MGWGNEPSLVNVKRHAADMRRAESEIEQLRTQVAAQIELNRRSFAELDAKDARIRHLAESAGELLDSLECVTAEREAWRLRHTKIRHALSTVHVWSTISTGGRVVSADDLLAILAADEVPR